LEEFDSRRIDSKAISVAFCDLESLGAEIDTKTL
jgi:hypothetical protein